MADNKATKEWKRGYREAQAMLARGASMQDVMDAAAANWDSPAEDGYDKAIADHKSRKR